MVGSHGSHQGGGRLAAGGLPSLPPGSVSGIPSTSLSSVPVPGAYAVYSNYGGSAGMSKHPVSSPQRGHQQRVPPGNNGHPPNSANNALGGFELTVFNV